MKRNGIYYFDFFFKYINIGSYILHTAFRFYIRFLSKGQFQTSLFLPFQTLSQYPYLTSSRILGGLKTKTSNKNTK